MAKINTTELMNEYQSSNMNVRDFCAMKKISPSSFYKHKQIFESNDFVDITELAKTTTDTSISITIGSATINVTENTDFTLLRKIITAISL